MALTFGYHTCKILSWCRSMSHCPSHFIGRTNLFPGLSTCCSELTVLVGYGRPWEGDPQTVTCKKKKGNFLF